MLKFKVYNKVRFVAYFIHALVIQNIFFKRLSVENEIFVNLLLYVDVTIQGLFILIILHTLLFTIHC